MLWILAMIGGETWPSGQVCLGGVRRLLGASKLWKAGLQRPRRSDQNITTTMGETTSPSCSWQFLFLEQHASIGFVRLYLATSTLRDRPCHNTRPGHYSQQARSQHSLQDSFGNVFSSRRSTCFSSRINTRISSRSSSSSWPQVCLLLSPLWSVLFGAGLHLWCAQAVLESSSCV